MSNFELHPNFSSKTLIVELPLCRVLLENEVNYPWILLVPRRPNIARIMELSREDQLLLLQELDLAQKVMWEKFQPTQLNVAAIGNKTPQLHVHVIARYSTDPAWPNTVWETSFRARYSEEQNAAMAEMLTTAFGAV